MNNQQSTNGSNKKKDFFGHPMKERFPYYPYGTIIPTCKGPKKYGSNAKKVNMNPPPRPRSQDQNCRSLQASFTRSQSSKHNKHRGQSQGQRQGRNNESSTSTVDSDSCFERSETQLFRLTSNAKASGPGDRKSSKNSTEICGRFAQIIAQELPHCNLEASFLEEIQRKCQCYWDTLNRYNIHLDEEAVLKELAMKLRGWVRNNQHLIESNSLSQSHSHFQSTNFDDDDHHDDRDHSNDLGFDLNFENGDEDEDENGDESYGEILGIPFDNDSLASVIDDLVEDD